MSVIDIATGAPVEAEPLELSPHDALQAAIDSLRYATAAAMVTRTNTPGTTAAYYEALNALVALGATIEEGT
jgi:hypothetical protein